jgi:hypothetical protein
MLKAKPEGRSVLTSEGLKGLSVLKSEKAGLQ